MGIFNSVVYLQVPRGFEVKSQMQKVRVTENNYVQRVQNLFQASEMSY